MAANSGALPPPLSDLILNSKEAQVTLTNACKAVGAPRLTHHDFRHFFATRCLEEGVEPNIVADWLGHADGGVLVLRIYGHVRPGEAARAASKLNF